MLKISIHWRYSQNNIKGPTRVAIETGKGGGLNLYLSLSNDSGDPEYVCRRGGGHLKLLNPDALTVANTCS